MNMDVVNMLRGGVLYVKVRKPQDVMMPGASDLPSKASQVGSGVSVSAVQCTSCCEYAHNSQSVKDGVRKPLRRLGMSAWTVTDMYHFIVMLWPAPSGSCK